MGNMAGPSSPDCKAALPFLVEGRSLTSRGWKRTLLRVGGAKCRSWFEGASQSKQVSRGIPAFYGAGNGVGAVGGLDAGGAIFLFFPAKTPAMKSTRILAMGAVRELDAGSTVRLLYSAMRPVMNSSASAVMAPLLSPSAPASSLEGGGGAEGRKIRCLPCRDD